MVALPNLPSVREVGRMAVPLGSRLVAGNLGLGRPARWARTGGVLSPLFPVLNADEVALLDLPSVQSSNPNLNGARVVRELGRLGIAALVVKGQVDAAARREAERSNLPLFVLPDDADIGRVARSIIRLISDREAQEEAQAAALYRHLGDAVAAGESLVELVGRLHRLVGHSVSVSSLDGKILASAGSTPVGSTELMRPLYVGETPVAVLSFRDEPKAMDEFSRIALEQGAAALALERGKMEAVEAAREGVQGDFVATLLLGEDDATLVARARAADYPLDAAQWVIIAVADGSVTEETIHAWVRRALAHAGTLGWQGRADVGSDSFPGINRGWRATLVLAGGSGEWDAGRRLFIDYLTDTWASDSRLSLSAGDIARGVEGLRHAYEQASDALSLGLRLFGSGHRYLHREMGLYRVLRHVQGTDDLDDFLDSTLAALEAYDREHEMELVPTLRVLLEQGGNISAAAKAMHLHRNSMVYRLERIREIANLDPTDPDDAFALRLALTVAPLR